MSIDVKSTKYPVFTHNLGVPIQLFLLIEKSERKASSDVDLGCRNSIPLALFSCPIELTNRIMWPTCYRKEGSNYFCIHDCQYQRFWPEYLRINVLTSSNTVWRSDGSEWALSPLAVPCRVLTHSSCYRRERFLCKGGAIKSSKCQRGNSVAWWSTKNKTEQRKVWVISIWMRFLLVGNFSRTLPTPKAHQKKLDESIFNVAT